jgi:hypothetical protein
VNGEGWTPTLTDELLELLTVLDRCVALEPAQADVLERICNAPLITRDELTDAGVLPVPTHAARPPAPSSGAVPPLF